MASSPLNAWLLFNRMTKCSGKMFDFFLPYVFNRALYLPEVCRITLSPHHVTINIVALPTFVIHLVLLS